MIRRAGPARWLTLGVAPWAFLLGSCLAAMAAGQAPALEIWGLQPARLLVRVALPPDDGFCLGHVNSIYEAPVRECFQARTEGGWWLVEVASPSPAVFEYYGLEPPAGGRASLRLPLGDFQVKSHDYSRHHLAVGGQSIPLGQLARPGEPLVFKAVTAP